LQEKKIQGLKSKNLEHTGTKRSFKPIKYRRIKLLDNASLEGLQAFTGKGTLAFLLTGFVLAFTLTSTEVL
jgi:hypothetical protein